MTSVVNNVLNKDKKDDKKINAPPRKTLAELAGDFVQVVMVEKGIAQPQSNVASSSKDEECTNVVQYNDKGEVEGAAYKTAINKGYKVGMYLQMKPTRNDDKTAVTIDHTQWKVTTIGDDGSFELTDVAADGTLCDSKSEVALEEIVELYRPCRAKEFLDKYPGIDANNDNELVKIEFKGMVASALMAMKFVPPAARIMMKPSRGLYATKDFDIGEYCVAPLSRSIVVDPKGPTKGIRVGINYAGAPVVFINPDLPSTEYASQFWVIRAVDNEAMANCEYKERTLLMSRATDDEKNGKETIQFVIPVICNVKEIEKDDEIIVYKAAVAAAPAAKKRAVKMLLESTTDKKSKTE
jgi:hypothetical protein